METIISLEERQKKYGPLYRQLMRAWDKVESLTDTTLSKICLTALVMYYTPHGKGVSNTDAYPSKYCLPFETGDKELYITPEINYGMSYGLTLRIVQNIISTTAQLQTWEQIYHGAFAAGVERLKGAEGSAIAWKLYQAGSISYDNYDLITGPLCKNDVSMDAYCTYAYRNMYRYMGRLQAYNAVLEMYADLYNMPELLSIKIKYDLFDEKSNYYNQELDRLWSLEGDRETTCFLKAKTSDCDLIPPENRNKLRRELELSDNFDLDLLDDMISNVDALFSYQAEIPLTTNRKEAESM